MRIVYMGSPACAIAPLAYLLTHGPAQGFEVVAAVSQPAKITGRGRQKAPADPALAQFAKSKGLTTLQPESAKDSAFLAELAALAPDVVITCAYGQILTADFLAIPRRATINIHPSALPKYRGATPVPATLLAGELETAVSILFTVRKLDAGPLIVQKAFAIAPTETADELMNRLFCEAGPLLTEALAKLADPHFQGTPQDEAAVTHCRKISKDDGAIAWDLPSQAILNCFRAYFPWPGSYTFLAGKRIVVEALMALGGEGKGMESLLGKECGAFYFDKNLDALVVKTKDRFLGVKQLKPEGGRSIDASSFWNGLKSKDKARFDHNASKLP